MKLIYDKIQEAVNHGKELVLCIITNTKGSTPRKTGAKMLVYDDGSIYGTIGGGDLEKKVIANALSVLKKKMPETFKHDLLHQHSMCCGGTVEIYLEPIMKKNKLYIFGAGHTGQALARQAVNFNFEVILIDDRKEYIDQCYVEEVNKMNLDFKQALALLPFDANTYICIMTYDHDIDREILSYCIRKEFAYVGMIGSHRKVAVTKKMFIEAGHVSEEEIKRVDMPMGIDILAETPEEIAISILAKLIMERRKTIK
ncbi:MAG: XdhC family protein [Bacteroidia bacterium]